MGEPPTQIEIPFLQPAAAVKGILFDHPAFGDGGGIVARPGAIDLLLKAREEIGSSGFPALAAQSCRPDLRTRRRAGGLGRHARQHHRHAADEHHRQGDTDQEESRADHGQHTGSGMVMPGA